MRAHARACVHACVRTLLRACMRACAHYCVCACWQAFARACARCARAGGHVRACVCVCARSAGAGAGAGAYLVRVPCCVAVLLRARVHAGARAAQVGGRDTHGVDQVAQPPLIATVVLEYPQTRCTLFFDADSVYGAEDRTAVRGTLGSLHSVGPSLTEQTVTGYTSDGWFQPKLSGEWFLEGFQGTMAELMNAIEEGDEPRNGARDNLRGLALCFAAVSSADLGEPVSVASVSSDA